MDKSPARRQIVEITDAGTLLTEYRRHCLRCLCCQKLNRAVWSKQTRGGTFGGRVVGVIGYLTGRLGISHRDAKDAMEELFAVKISLGSISAAQKRLSQTLAAPVAALHELVEKQLVSLVDAHIVERKADEAVVVGQSDSAGNRLSDSAGAQPKGCQITHWQK